MKSNSDSNSDFESNFTIKDENPELGTWSEKRSVDHDIESANGNYYVSIRATQNGGTIIQNLAANVSSLYFTY